MTCKFFRSTLCSLAVLSTIQPLYAAIPIKAQNTDLQQLQQHFSLVFQNDSNHTICETKDALQLVHERVDANRVRHVRMQQKYFGFPVFGGYAIVHTKQIGHGLVANQANSKMNGLVYQDLERELGEVPQGFVKNGDLALQTIKKAYQGQTITDEEVTPMVYVNEQHQAVWAYKVQFLVTYKDKIPEKPTMIVDAKTHKPLLQWNDIKTIKEIAKATGFGGNERVSKHQYGDGLPLLEIRRNAMKQLCYMENQDVKVVDMEHRYFHMNSAMRFDCLKPAEGFDNVYWTGLRGDGYDMENGSYSPSNDALFAGYVIANMYQNWYNIPALTMSNGKAKQLIMRVHYGDGYQNAYWDGKQMTFGDGGSLMYPLVSIGIGAHEISHGFTQQHSDLVYNAQSGGINESFSDMAAVAAEYFYQGKNTWEIGAEILKKDSGYKALRFMNKPSLDGRSIDRADQYYPGLNVHYSSGVYNRLFYLLSNKPGWDTRKAFDVMVKANMDYWTPYATYETAGCGVLNATLDLNYPIRDVQKVLKMVAISYDNCDFSSFLNG